MRACLLLFCTSTAQADPLVDAIKTTLPTSIQETVTRIESANILSVRPVFNNPASLWQWKNVDLGARYDTKIGDSIAMFIVMGKGFKIGIVKGFL